MANVILLNDIIRERVICFDTYSRQLGVNVIYHKCTSVVGALTDADVASARSSSHATPYKGWLSSRSAYMGVGIQIIKPTLRPEVLSGVAGGAGSASSTQLPTQLCGLLRWRTATELTGETAAARKYNPHGRIYIPFPASVWAGPEGEMFETAARPQLTAIKATFPVTTSIAGTGVSGDFQMGLICQSTRTFVSVTSTEVVIGWATQRRRGDFGQTNLNPL